MARALPAAVSLTTLAITVCNARTARLRATGARAEAGPAVDVFIPARDEAQRIDGLIADLRSSRGIAHLRVHILDDASADATGDVVREAVAGDPRFDLRVSHEEPPAGWTGKSFALQRLTDAVLDEPGPADRVLVFLDADVRLEPDALADAVHAFGVGARAGRAGSAGSSGLFLLSIWPAQLADDLLGRLVQPLLAWSWLATVPLNLTERRPRASTAVAIGQFLVTDERTYRSIGGHRGVAGAVAEDVALARLIRTRGGRTAVRTSRAPGGRVRCRMYDNPRQTWSGHRRWLVAAFGGPITAAAVAAGAALIWVTPALELVCRRGNSRMAGAALAAGISSRLVARQLETGHLSPVDFASATTHPAAIAISAAVVADAVVADLRGRRPVWRGRAVPRS